MERSTRENMGNLRISKDVLATIAKHVACEVDGVAGMVNSPARLKKFRNFFSSASSSSKSVDVEISDDMAVIDVYVALKYGANIPRVSEKIQKNIKDAVLSMTSIVVSKVNVHIAGIAFDKSEK